MRKPQISNPIHFFHPNKKIVVMSSTMNNTVALAASRVTTSTELPADIIASILKRLPFREVVRAKVVSSSWKSAAETTLGSNSHLRFVQSPWLMLLPEQHLSFSSRFSDWIDGAAFRFMNFEENKIYGLTKATSEVFPKCPCIGSSHGWLIFLDPKTSTPFLLNPFTAVQIHQIPSLEPLIHDILKIEAKVKIKPSDLVLKTILTKEPVVGDYGMFMCFGRRASHVLGFWKNGNSSWVQIDDGICYKDIVWDGKELYALRTNGSVVTWDLQGDAGCPRKVTTIHTAFPEKSSQLLKENGSNGTYIKRRYLVESGKEILLVERFMFLEFGNISHYRSKLFDIYKLDLEKEEWVVHGSLGNQSLFLNKNHSVSIPTKNLKTCKENSIYFADFSWGPRKGNATYVYCLKDEQVTLISEFASKTISSWPFCWLVPHHL